MKLVTQLTIIILIAFSYGFADTFDVVQPTYTVTNDLNSNGTSGQTFTATQPATLKGIRLYVEGMKRSGNYPFGSSFKVSLHRVLAGKIQNPPITSRIIYKDVLQLGVPVEIDVYFSQPYTQTAGEVLAFTILESSGGGSNGWNEYGMTSGNVYTQGSQFYGYASDGTYTEGTNDFAFSTIIEGDAVVVEPPVVEIPVPIVNFTFEPAYINGFASSELSIPETIAGYEYICYYTENFTVPIDQWSAFHQTGTGGPMSWSLGYLHEPTSLFFYVEVKSPE